MGGRAWGGAGVAKSTRWKWLHGGASVRHLAHTHCRPPPPPPPPPARQVYDYEENTASTFSPEVALQLYDLEHFEVSGGGGGLG